MNAPETTDGAQPKNCRVRAARVRQRGQRDREFRGWSSTSKQSSRGSRTKSSLHRRAGSDARERITRNASRESRMTTRVQHNSSMYAREQEIFLRSPRRNRTAAGITARNFSLEVYNLSMRDAARDDHDRFG